MDPPQLPALDNVVNFDLSTLNLRDISPTFIFQDIPFTEIPAIPSTSQQAPNQSIQSPNPEYNPRSAVQMRPPMVTYYPEISSIYFPVLIQSPNGNTNWKAPPMHQEVYHPWNICPTLYQAPVSKQDVQQMVWQEVRDMEGQNQPNMEVTREKTLNSPSVLDEETLKERAFEEYNTIMDSLQIEEPQTEDKWLEELYKDDEKFLQYLEDLCSDSEFVRNVGSTLNVDFWSSIMSEDPNPLELYGLEENHQQKQQIQPNVYNPSVTSAEASLNCPEPQKSNENSHFDDISPEVLNKAVDLLLQAVSEIPDPPQSSATVEENYEAQMNGEDKPLIPTTSSPSQDLSTSSCEIVSWSELDTQIQATFHPSTPTHTPPVGSPLLPSNQLCTPDNHPTATLSSNFDEDILLNFSSPQDSIANSTPPCSDPSIDLDTMAEMLLREDINEDSYLDLELAQPQSLSTLALKAVLNLDQAKEDENKETESQKSTSPDYEALSIDFGSVLQSSDNGEADFESEIPKVYKDLVLEMEEESEVLQNLNQEETVAESKDESKCFEIVSERKLVRRSLRLSLQMQKADETQEMTNFEKTTVESLKNGDGDCKIVKKSKIQERGRSEDRKRKIEDSPNVDFGRYRTRSAGDLKILPNLRPRGRSQNKKQSPKQEVLEFQMQENGGKVSPLKRNSQYGGDFKESLSDNFESQEKKAKLRSARGGYGESKIETRQTRKLKMVEVENRKITVEKEKKVASNIYNGRTRIQRKYQDFVTGKTNNVRRSQRRKCRRNEKI